MVNGPDDVYVERKGQLESAKDGLIEGEEAVLHVIERIVAPLGLRVDESSRWVDARLSDGSRVQTRFLSKLTFSRALLGRHRVIARKGRGKMDRDDPAYKGQAGYNPFLLAIYDQFVLGFMARVVWRCPTPPIVERYRQHLGRRHLDVGPGTGYFIEQARPPAGTKVTLLDPNPNVLARSSRMLAAMHPTTIEADVMKPLPVDGPFDSVALNYVLHCLRGPQSHKAVAIRNVAAVLEPDGVLFGGTVLGTAERHTLQARAILWAFNRKGDFDNLGDNADGLREILEESFQTVEVDVIGSVAHFTATGPHGAR